MSSNFDYGFYLKLLIDSGFRPRGIKNKRDLSILVCENISDTTEAKSNESHKNYVSGEFTRLYAKQLLSSLNRSKFTNFICGNVSDTADLAYKISENITEYPSLSEFFKDARPDDNNIAEALTELLVYVLKGCAGIEREPFVPGERGKLASVHSPCLKRWFGRDEMPTDIRSLFKNGNQVVFIEGMGGIGKSEIAKQYADKFSKSPDGYDTVVFARYEKGELCELVANDRIFSLSGISPIISKDGTKETSAEYAERKLGIIKKFTDEKTLIIIDNLDVPPDQLERDALWQELTQNIPYHLLITTRCRQRTDRIGFESITAKELDDGSIAEMMTYYHSENRIGAGFDPGVPEFAELLGLTCRHTLTLMLIAVYMAQTQTNVPRMVEILKKSGIAGLDRQSLSHEKITDHIIKIITKIFDLSALGESEKYFLRCISITPDVGIYHEIFAEWLGDTYDKCAVSLIRRNLVSCDSTGLLSLHPIIRQVITEELVPSFDSCKEFLDAFVAEAHDIVSFNISPEKRYVCSLMTKKLIDTLELNAKSFDFFYSISKFYVISSSDPLDDIPFKKRLYELAVREHGKDSLAAARVAIQIGNSYLSGGKFDDALQWQQDIALFALEKQDPNSMDAELLNEYYTESEKCLDQLGYIYQRRSAFVRKSDEDTEKSIRYFNMGYDAAKKIVPSDKYPKYFIDYKAAYALMGLARTYSETQNAEGLRRCIEETKTLYQSSTDSGINIAHDLEILEIFVGRGLFLDGCVEKAIETLENCRAAIRRYDAKRRLTTTTSITLYLYLADCYQKTNRTERQCECLLIALGCAKKNYSPEHPLCVSLEERIGALD